MSSAQRQSSEHGFMSQEDANSNGHSNGTDDDAGFLCICGTNDPGKWIECGNRSCTIRWFHLTCTSLEEVPAGLWLCAECKQTLTADDHTRSPKQKLSITPEFPGLSRVAPVQPRNEARVKKGVAIKKVMPKKKKSPWKGWVEVSEIENKKRKRLVEEPWAVRILPQQRRSGMNESKEIKEGSVEKKEDQSDEEPLPTRNLRQRRRSNIKTKAGSVKSQGRAKKVRIVEDEIDTDDEPLSTRNVLQRRRSNIKTKAVSEEPLGPAQKVRIVENESETDEEPLPASMKARQGRLRAKVGAKIYHVDRKDTGHSRAIREISSEIQGPILSWDRSSSVECVAQDTTTQNQAEVGNETYEEFRSHMDQKAYDGMKEEANIGSPENSDEDIVREPSATGDDTESEFEGFSDDEETADHVSISSDHEMVDDGEDSGHEATSGSDISINTAADCLLNAAAGPMQQRSSPNASSGASSNGDSGAASHLQRHKTSVRSSGASQAAEESENSIITTAEYETLGERSTLPRLE